MTVSSEISAYAWARSQARLTATQKFVLLMIADLYKQQDGFARCSFSYLADATCLSISSCVRAVKALEQKGLVNREAWKKEASNAHAPNRYLLPLYGERTRKLTADPPAGEVREMMCEFSSSADLITATF